jgi:hypothetical protein
MANTITLPQMFAIRGAVPKYAMEFCLKHFPVLFAISQCASVLLSLFGGKTPRNLYSPLSAIISPKRKLMNVNFKEMKYTCH